jgi:hypothetical protein
MENRKEQISAVQLQAAIKKRVRLNQQQRDLAALLAGRCVGVVDLRR